MFRTEKTIILRLPVQDLYICNWEQFQRMLKERLSQADIRQAKADVLPFVRNPRELDIWSNNYFVQLAGMIRYC